MPTKKDMITWCERRLRSLRKAGNQWAASLLNMRTRDSGWLSSATECIKCGTS